jgi:hypothetical protein
MNIHALDQALSVLARQHQPSLEDLASFKVLLACEYIAYRLALPTTAIEQPKQYFLTQHKLTVLDWLTQLNERFVFNIDEAVTLVFELWRYRYSFAHEGPNHRYGRALTGGNLTVTGMLSDPYRALLTRYPTVYLTQELIDGYR